MPVLGFQHGKQNIKDFLEIVNSIVYFILEQTRAPTVASGAATWASGCKHGAHHAFTKRKNPRDEIVEKRKAEHIKVLQVKAYKFDKMQIFLIISFMWAVAFLIFLFHVAFFKIAITTICHTCFTCLMFTIAVYLDKLGKSINLSATSHMYICSYANTI